MLPPAEAVSWEHPMPGPWAPRGFAALGPAVRSGAQQWVRQPIPPRRVPTHSSAARSSSETAAFPGERDRTQWRNPSETPGRAVQCPQHRHCSVSCFLLPGSSEIFCFIHRGAICYQKHHAASRGSTLPSAPLWL